jgi:NSS family neurotransmitter:Na+ symporter
MSEKVETKSRDTFKSQFGLIMSVAGLSIGLGNCWRFPYLCGKWGGGSFVFAYLVGSILIVVPLAIIEVSVGKGTGKGNINFYSEAYHNRVVGKILGSLTAFFQWAQNFYYLAIVAAIIYFIYAAATSMWNVVEPTEIYSLFTSNTFLYIVLYMACLVLVIYTGFRGVNKGIEAISKVLVPLMIGMFILTFILTCIYTPNIVDGINYYLNPDFTKLKNPQLWAAAIAQALFSIGVGPGALLVYGSHMKYDAEVPLTIATTCAMDTMAGLLAGLTIIPACVANGIDPQSGSSLIFLVLPQVFKNIPFGNVIAIFLFLGIFCAAYTSACSNQECAITSFSDGYNWSRKKTIAIIAVLNAVFGLTCMLSESSMTFWQTATGDFTFLPSAALGGITFVYVYGIRKIREKFINPFTKYKLGRWFDHWVQFVAVPVMVFFMAKTFIELF